VRCGYCGQITCNWLRWNAPVRLGAVFASLVHLPDSLTVGKPRSPKPHTQKATWSNQGNSSDVRVINQRNQDLLGKICLAKTGEMGQEQVKVSGDAAQAPPHCQ
ncbi:MAG: hypothetical protein PF630_09895, partial [Gammaproteobacteria bacterium]|jgi:hypothetical protein|nr:hypothetical protein [Gammaproteobacteria bacterium]